MYLVISVPEKKIFSLESLEAVNEYMQKLVSSYYEYDSAVLVTDGRFTWIYSIERRNFKREKKAYTYTNIFSILQQCLTLEYEFTIDSLLVLSRILDEQDYKYIATNFFDRRLT